MHLATARQSTAALPDIDERLVSPGTGYEIEDGRIVYVPPASEPQARCHGCLSSLARAHRAQGYAVASNMLTRASPIDDFAPHVSVYPSARDPRTGGRQVEELAFVITRTGWIPTAGRRAAKLAARGVRRVLALDVELNEALEWSNRMGAWLVLAPNAQIEDPALVIPIPAEALFDADRADDAVVRAWRTKRHPEFLAEREAGRAEGRGQVAVIPTQGKDVDDGHPGVVER
jgi:hypothetical protein